MDVSFTITLGCFSLIVVLWYIWRKRRMSYFERHGIPGPKPNFFTGNLGSQSKHGDLALEWTKKYGKIFGFYFGAHPFLVVGDVELLKLIQVKEFKTFMARSPLIADLAIPHLYGKDAIFMQTDNEWKNARNVLSPAFTTGRLKMMLPVLAESVDIFMKKIAETGQKTFDIYLLFKLVTFDAVGKMSFGISTNVQNNNTNQFIRSVYRSFDADSSDFLASLSMRFPELGPIPHMLRIVRDGIRHRLKLPSVTTVIETCAEIVKMRRDHPKNARPDLLQGLVDASKSPNESQRGLAKQGLTQQMSLSEREVLANAFGFMLAGYDGVSVILTWCIHFLVEHPGVQDKLRQEIKKNIKDKIEYDMLNNLPYLDQVISETLRLFPFSAVGLNRVASEEFKYKNITIPKHMNISIPIYPMNMDPDYWEEPEIFKPERFSPENEAKVNNLVYQPFGAGPRICIGMRFAQLLLKFLLASLLHSYKLVKPPDGKPFEQVYTVFSIKPKYGLGVRAIPA